MIRPAIASLLLLLSFAATAAAQEPCPTISITFNNTTNSTILQGSNILTAMPLSGSGVGKTYLWTTSVGKIDPWVTEDTAVLDATGVPFGTAITITAEAKGFGCKAVGQVTAKVTPVSANPVKAPAACPTMRIDVPENGTSTGRRHMLIAWISGGDPSIKPQVKWTTTAGKGETSSSPTYAYLDTTAVPIGTIINIEAEATGYGCTVKGQATIKMIKHDPTLCPAIKLSSPPVVKENERFTISANVVGGDRTVKPIFKWSYSGVVNIISGGGYDSSSVTVESNTVGVRNPITATLDVGGYVEDCETIKTVVTRIEGIAPRLVDDIGFESTFVTVKLSSYATNFYFYDSANAVMIYYAGRNGRKGQIETFAEWSKTQLMEDARIPASSIQIVNGGFRDEPVIELWVVPSGAKPPVATPTTVAAKKVPKPAPKPSMKGCPVLTLRPPDENTPIGNMLFIHADLTGADPKIKPTYKWSIDGGKIGMGQGTDSIVVDTTGAPMLINATVSVEGYPFDCVLYKATTAFLSPAKK